MNLNVPEKWEPFIRSKMQSGHYRSEDEVLDEALLLLKQRDSEHAEVMRCLIPCCCSNSGIRSTRRRKSGSKHF